jgi:hypothetical protein
MSITIGVHCNRSHRLRFLLGPDGHRSQCEFVSSNFASWRKRHLADRIKMHKRCMPLLSAISDYRLIFHRKLECVQCDHRSTWPRVSKARREHLVHADASLNGSLFLSKF